MSVPCSDIIREALPLQQMVGTNTENYSQIIRRVRKDFETLSENWGGCLKSLLLGLQTAEEEVEWV